MLQPPRLSQLYPGTRLSRSVSAAPSCASGAPVHTVDMLSAPYRACEQVAGEMLQPPRPLEWFPNKLAWHMSFSRAQLRKLPILSKIHDMLKRENDGGAITRQEAVSMVPPLFLDVQPQHRVCSRCRNPRTLVRQRWHAVTQKDNMLKHEHGFGAVERRKAVLPCQNSHSCPAALQDIKQTSGLLLAVHGSGERHFVRVITY